MQLLMIRHGETEWNRTGRWQGNQDVPLSEAGRQRIVDLSRAVASWVCESTKIYSSDLTRARDTAAALFPRHQQRILCEPRLREIGLGRWEGLNRQEIESRYQELFKAFDGPDEGSAPGGETFGQCKERVRQWWDEQQAQWSAVERVIVVAHGGSLRALLFALIPDLPNSLRKHFALENLGVSVIQVDLPNLATVRCWNMKPEWIGRELNQC